MNTGYAGWGRGMGSGGVYFACRPCRRIGLVRGGRGGGKSWRTVFAPPLPVPRPRLSGFTLIEVLAAIALLAIVFAVALGALGKSAQNASHAAALDAAVEHAQSLFATQGLTEPLKNGDSAGTFADGMHWTLRVKMLPRPAAGTGADAAVSLQQQGGALMAQAAGVDVYQLDATVQYGAGRVLRLSTERAQAAPADGDQE